MITFPQTNFQKSTGGIGFDVKILDVLRFLTKMANGNLSLTAGNYRTSSIFLTRNESIRATTSTTCDKSQNVVCDTWFHCRSDSERKMNPAKIIVHKIERDIVRQVLQLFRVAVGETREINKLFFTFALL
jgi:hypothetical protein